MTSEKLKIDKEQFNNMKSMILSQDLQDHTVALQCIEHSDYEGSLAAILLLFKISNTDVSQWTENAPITYGKILKLGIKTMLSYMDISFILIKEKANIEQIQFLFDAYSEYLKGFLTDNGLTVTDVQIKITQ